MLCFAAFVPHPLISIPDIGKSHTSKVRKTVRACATLTQELYASKPDRLIILSEHGVIVPNAINIYQRPTGIVEFSEFGDLSDRYTVSIDIGTGYRIKESSETSFPIIMTESESLDYGTGVVFVNLLAHQPQFVPLVPISIGLLPKDELIRFGEYLSSFIHDSSSRIAVIGSGDLAHGSSKSAPSGYKIKAAAFNALLKKTMESGSLLSLDSELDDAQMDTIDQCTGRIVRVLSGLLKERRHTFEVLAYDTAFGIGYITARVHLS